jgi:hypothetical protein
MANDDDLGHQIVRGMARGYAYRLLLVIVVLPLMVLMGAAAAAIGGGVGHYFGLSENATMFVMLGVFFSPLLLMVWWPQGWWPRRRTQAIRGLLPRGHSKANDER